ncbi:retention module-containing protein, partial [Pseudomonas tumuqii]|uniref:retention module-containing protein n=1 Tax=Pseudomonas tumuqii TaxID=2715755 RepID=UPI001555BD92
MSNFVAVIKSLVGQVFVVSLDGLKRQVFEGERLFQGDQVVTASGGSATLELANGDAIDIAANGNWQTEGDQAAEPAQAAQAPASELEQAIAAGFDPTADLEPTAAGPGAAGGAGGAAGGGHSFVMLDETAQQLDPTVGFETEGLGLAAATPVEEQAPEPIEALETANTTPPVVSISIDPITDDNILNAQELLGDMLTITGTVGGDAKLGDTITLNVGGSLYNGTVIQRPDSSLGFEIEVGTGDLREASSITATISSTDAAGNTGTATVERGYDVDTTANITVSLDDVNSANVANALISGTSDVGAGRTVTLVITDANGDTVTTTATTDADGNYSITEDLSSLADGNLTVDASVTDAAGNPATATDATSLLDTSAEATISLNAIAGDDILNANELGGDIVQITGSVGGDAKAGDTVTLTLGSTTYSGPVIELADGTLGFAINVGTGDLRDNTQIEASVTATDSNGNTVTAEADRGYSVDTSAAASISLDAIAGDDILNAAEAAADVAVSGSVGGDAQEG